MVKRKNKYSKFDLEENSDFLNELEDCLDALSNRTRLEILKLIMNKPQDTRTISNKLKTSYVNTRKHLHKLFRVGFVERKVGEGSRGPVWKYSAVPTSLELLIRNLGIFSEGFFSKIDLKEESEIRVLLDRGPVIKVLSGPERGKLFPLKKDTVKIGRLDPFNNDEFDKDDVVLSEDYRKITRVSQPHCQLNRKRDGWYIKNFESEKGTFLNGRKIRSDEELILNHEDIIKLSEGTPSECVHLLLILPDSYHNQTQEIKLN